MECKSWSVIFLVGVLCCPVAGVIRGCRPGISCSLPECHCLKTSPPKGLPKSSIPQIVLFTFDDAVRAKELRYYSRLFRRDRRNPNGCPIRMTLFVQDSNTEYGAVRTLHQRGMEVAAHSITHRSPQSVWKTMTEDELQHEVYGQKLNIHRKAGVPLDDIRGWRSPFLQPSGNTQFEVLTTPDYGFTYDSSLASEKRFLNDDSFWPFTLDFGAGPNCGTPPCPTGKYPGFWEFLITPLIDNEDFPRTYVDSYRPENVSQSYKYLMRNFESHHQGTRSPFMVNMHAAWFAYTHNLEAMDKFIETLLKKNDVYIITIQQAIEWLRSPTPLESLAKFQPWGCSSLPTVSKEKVTVTVQPFTFASVRTTPQQTLGSQCVQKLNCRLPACRCGNSGNPGNLPDRKIPQMVLFAFEGSVNKQNINYFNRLFPAWRKNPNSSPVAITLFLSDDFTDYKLVKQLYDRGMEVAVHSSGESSSSRFWQNATPQELERKIFDQRNNIHLLAGIPLESIQGWRSPFLQPSGDRLFTVLEQNGFKYDSTLTVTKSSLKDRTDWPFTLDYGWSNICLTEPCPNNRYPGFWVFPVVNMVNYQTGLPCRYVDSCLPSNKTMALKYLWKNFESHYTSNRAPFMLNLHTSWFEMNPVYFAAVREFIDGLSKLNDVYIVTVQQALQWLKKPTEVSALASFSPWTRRKIPEKAFDRKPDYKKNNGTGMTKDGTDVNQTSESGRPDWVVVVLVVIAGIFGVCIVFTVGVHIVRKRQLQIRANSIKEAMTVTSDRNSVTDWLNTFPRRFSQVSYPTTDNFEVQKRGLEFDNVNFDRGMERESSTDAREQSAIIHANPLTLNPELLETNYSRDIAIWNQQEKKIPHIVHKSLKRKPKDGKVHKSGLQVGDIQANAKLRANRTQEAGSKKPWAFVWDLRDSEIHSETVYRSEPHKHRRRSAHPGANSDKTPAKRPASTCDEQTFPRGTRAYSVHHSGHYDLCHSDGDSQYTESHPSGALSTTGRPRYKRQNSGKDSSEASTCTTTLEHGLESPPVSQINRRTSDCRLSPCRAKVKALHKRSKSSPDEKFDKGKPPRYHSFHVTKSHEDTRRRSESFDRAGDSCPKPRGQRRNRRSSDGSDHKHRYSRSADLVSNQKDPRITKEIEVEWERELRKQLDKFLKSKNALKGLEYYR